MRNLTFKERAIVVGAILTLLLGAGHRYHRAQTAGSEALAITEASDAKS
jgi:hypothetical protein